MTVALLVAAVLTPAAHSGPAHFPGCESWACVRRVKRERWARRHPWVHRWNRLSTGDRAWLRSTARCESGNNPHTNTGNGFYGLVQFTASTARAAGFKRLPHLTSWHEQAVRAVWWMHSHGRGQWPVCG